MSSVVAMMVFAGVVGATYYATTRFQQRAIDDLTRRLDLEVVSSTPLRLAGVVQGHPIEVVRDDRGDQPATLVVVSLEFPLPPGFSLSSATAGDHVAERWLGRVDVKLGNDLDDHLTLWGPRDDIRALLAVPVIDALVRELVEDDVRISLDGMGLRLNASGAPIHVGLKTVERAVALASAVEEALVRPWSELQAQLGLRDESDAHRRRLAGNVRGVPLIVQQHRPGRGDLVLRVTAQLTAPLPEGTHVCHPDKGRGRSQRLGDPVLDQLHVSGDAEALGARLCRDSVRAPLMELLHGNPGSVLTSERIGVLLYDTTLDPRPWVDRVLELERALR